MKTIATYRPRNAEIQAVQWTGDNEDEITKLAGFDFDPADPDEPFGDDLDATAAIREGRHGTWKYLHTGDWAIRDADGRLDVIPADEFAKAYERVAATDA